MSSLHIILHCLPREIDDLERIVNQLKTSSHYLRKNDEVILDFTLNLSKNYTDWDKSLLPKDFFIEKYEVMKAKSDWTSKNIFEINDVDDDRCLGINDKRRNSIREHQADNFMYLDTDVFFSQYNLSYMFRAIENIEDEYYILNSQLLRLWDESWNIISNDRYIPMGYDSKIWLKYDPFKIDSEVYNYLDEVKIKKLSSIKFGGGWFNLFSANLLKYIDIPDSFGSYGLDDTFVFECAKMMKLYGHKINQYTLDNMLVCENRRYRDLNPYEKFICDNTNNDEFKQKFRDVANEAYSYEINYFLQKKLK